MKRTLLGAALAFLLTSIPAHATFCPYGGYLWVVSSPDCPELVDHAKYANYHPAGACGNPDFSALTVFDKWGASHYSDPGAFPPTLQTVAGSAVYFGHWLFSPKVAITTHKPPLANVGTTTDYIEVGGTIEGFQWRACTVRFRAFFLMKAYDGSYP